MPKKKQEDEKTEPKSKSKAKTSAEKLEEKNKPSYYVGIGASAGGLEAIESFFKSMSDNSGATFIIVQHLSPDYKSLMPELMTRRTTMPVHRIEDGMPALANNVYLIPPKKNLKIFHGKLILSEQSKRDELHLPIDLFFKSLAEDKGSRAIGIILSGTGSDGTRGIKAIKENDGMVMVQNEESAKFDGMPRSVIATGLADFILSPSDMPQQLVSFINHPYKSKQEHNESNISNETGLTRIYALLRERTRVDFTFYKPATVKRRIERRMMINNVLDLNDYIRYLEIHKTEIDTLYGELLIGVTSFFRDPEAYDLLREKYLRELIMNSESKDMRIWVAGCSTGEEAYSLAILCLDIIEKTGIHRDIKIFSTDIDKNALDTASMGKYPAGIAADVPAKYLAKYFNKTDMGYQISRAIREMVVFAPHNIIKDPPFTNIDLISCRNLLIYLQPVLQQKALELFNFSLQKNGIMFLGSSESTGEMKDYYKTLNQKWRLYRSVGKRKQSGMPLVAATTLFDQSRTARSRLAGNQAAVRLQHEEERILDRFIQSFASDFVLFAMALNSNMDVVHAIGDTGTFLKMQPGTMTTDAVKLMPQELAIPLSTGVIKVLKTNQPLTFSKIRLSIDGKPHNIEMRIKPLNQKKGQDPLVGVYIKEMHSSDSSGTEDISYDVSKETEDRLIDLEQELQFTRENLQATVEELETSNEELQATNEELLASNEELQSTNEELQSVNEELYTVNAEYQSKITELTEVNNDLDNLLASTHIGSLFLDEDLEIRRFSRKLSELLNIIDTDIGRPIRHISHNLGKANLAEIAKDVLNSQKLSEFEFRSIHEKWYLVRFLPYQIASEVYSGVVVLFIDITAQKNFQIALERSKRLNSLAHKFSSMGIFEWNIDENTVQLEDNLYRIFGLTPKEFNGKYEDFTKLIHPEDVSEVEEAMQKAIEFKKPYSLEHRIVCPDKQVKWVIRKGELYQDEQNQKRYIIGMIQEITEKKSLQEEIRKMKLSSGKILHVDDDKNQANAIKNMIHQILKNKYEVITAANGCEGIMLAARHNPVLIITDLIMPGMDGFQMIQNIEKDPLLKATPICVLSGMGSEEIKNHGSLPDRVTVINKSGNEGSLPQSLKKVFENTLNIGL
ncbi:MAG: PAS domain-containing protein [Spirochaetia bacterium]|nr:PAS domain-containing protein [Spirochaetia bacterium]